MAGPGKATWVKVAGKGGRVTTRAIGMTQGGGQFTQGQTITQSEFNQVRKQAAEAGTKRKQETSLASFARERSLSDALNKAGIRSVDDIPEPIKKQINDVRESVASRRRKEEAKIQKSARVIDFATSDLSYGLVKNKGGIDDAGYRTTKEKNRAKAKARQSEQSATKQGKGKNPETIDVYTLGVLQQAERFGNERQIKRARDLHKKAVDFVNETSAGNLFESYTGKNWMKDYADENGVYSLISEAISYKSRKGQ